MWGGRRRHYGQAEPLDVAEDYGWIDCPVDICAGRADGVIARENVRPLARPPPAAVRGAGPRTAAEAVCTPSLHRSLAAGSTWRPPWVSGLAAWAACIGGCGREGTEPPGRMFCRGAA